MEWGGVTLCLNDGQTEGGGEVPDLHPAASHHVESVSLQGQGRDVDWTEADNLSLPEARGGAVDQHLLPPSRGGEMVLTHSGDSQPCLLLVGEWSIAVVQVRDKVRSLMP